MASVYPAALSHFAIFCPELGADEDNTHEQLLFYAAATLPAFYPYSANDYFARSAHLRRRSSGSQTTSHIAHSPSSRSTTATNNGGGGGVKSDDGVDGVLRKERVVSLDMKLREIGLAAALVAFAGTFASGHPCHVVHSEKRRTVILQPEKGVLIQLSIVLPRSVRPFGKEKDAYSIEFLDSELSDEAVKVWLLQEYWAFRVLFGPIGRALSHKSSAQKQAVRRQLDAFFGSTLWSWDFRWDRRHGDELDLLHALQPLPQMPIGAISLGGFDEFWRDLSALTQAESSSNSQNTQDDQRGGDRPVVSGAVVLWRGKELVWSSWLDTSADAKGSEDQVHALRALVAWSRAVYAPAFSRTEASLGNTAGDARSPNSKRQRSRTQDPGHQRGRATRYHVASYVGPGGRDGGDGGAGEALAASADSRSAGSDVHVAPEASAGSIQAHGSVEGAASNGGWTVPGASWLWGWRKQDGGRQQQTQESSEAASESSEGSGSEIANSGGLSQALSRAVNALVEPRPPTPPEVDPVFSQETQAEPLGVVDPAALGNTSAASQRYTIPAADIEAALSGDATASSMNVPFARDSDAESLRSVGSMASVQTTATASVALSRHPAAGGLVPSGSGRMRANTLQHGGANTPPHGLPPMQWMPGRARLGRHSRAPSVVSNSTVGTVDSTQLRDDTRVSSRSWWSGWGWGTSRAREAPTEASVGSLELTRAMDGLSIVQESDGGNEECASGIDLASTFLFTGELPFPGLLSQTDTSRCRQNSGLRVNRPEVIRVEEDGDDTSLEAEDASEDGGKRMETISQLGVAMEEELPAVYEHGADVDISRGVVLAPRAIEGMQYDTRLVRLMYGQQQVQGSDGQLSANASAAVAESPLFVELAGGPTQTANKTLAYKYGDMLFLIFGAPPGSSDDSACGTKEVNEDEEFGSSNVGLEDDGGSTLSGGGGGMRSRRRDRRRRLRQQRQQQRQTRAARLSTGEDEASNGRHEDETRSSGGVRRFSAPEAQAIEGAILRYAESLQAATKRDASELQIFRKSEVQSAQQRRIPPYVHQECGRRLTRTNWKHDGPLPLNRSYLGFVPHAEYDDDANAKRRLSRGQGNNRGTRGAGEDRVGWSGLPANVRRTLALVNAEVAKNRGKGVAVCARMQDKGWVAGMGVDGEQEGRGGSECYCVVDQPRATLADAQAFLSKISRRAETAHS
ncbi:hypothetical protein GQ54DRAFT_299458 [Martensiomyces pterosporus]|nr:hypothetical protein GQ54DRAFT_299458 [Martensiomyces pterosporus]